MSFGNALLISLLGLGVVFFALVLIMCIILLMTKLSAAAERRTAPAPTAAPPAPAEAPAVQPLTLTLPLAPGTAGNIKLYDTDPRTAAMLMAIVADESGIPLNELRFLSIREIR